ncbi:MAG TPA: RdgB/HAM1 family non-canonical purine NTP pyrophosphatase [Vicinamibacterales bacterium]|nr:RdgB/HAM1 family non-canonical purine NTP pyrophosphatase [Vicinamibacterales bacterium]
MTDRPPADRPPAAPIRLLVATTNRDKLREIRGILADAPVELLTLNDVPPVEPPEETGRSFEENARQKATYYARATGLPTVAEDSGLEIDALDGRPGVESARFGGAGATYPQKFALLYDGLRQRGLTTSTARFVCAVVCAEGDRVVIETRGVVEGRIAPAPSGAHGFGYDPIFFYPPYGRTLAEVTEAEKTAVSHRGQAFRDFGRRLKGLTGRLSPR